MDHLEGGGKYPFDVVVRLWDWEASDQSDRPLADTRMLKEVVSMVIMSSLLTTLLPTKEFLAREFVITDIDPHSYPLVFIIEYNRI